jgi:hypothetical protein
MNGALEQATKTFAAEQTERSFSPPLSRTHPPGLHTLRVGALRPRTDVRVFASHEQLLCLRHRRWLGSGDLKSPTNATYPKPLWLCSNPPPTQATNPLPSPPLSRHSETRRASGETPARFTPHPGARPRRR